MMKGFPQSSRRCLWCCYPGWPHGIWGSCAVVPPKVHMMQRTFRLWADELRGRHGRLQVRCMWNMWRKWRLSTLAYIHIYIHQTRCIYTVLHSGSMITLALTTFSLFSSFTFSIPCLHDYGIIVLLFCFHLFWFWRLKSNSIRIYSST